MVTINLTLNNFSELPALLDVFSLFGNDYEYTIRGIFRRKIPPVCSICNSPMVHNGYNPHTKQVLEKSTLIDINAQIVVVHTKKIIVFGKI
jgi:hypothetical protein